MIVMDRDELIDRWIEPDRLRPGADEARLRQHGMHVWALVGHYQAIGGDAAQVARDYRLPVEAVEAALAYYQKHKCLIDARLAANAA